MTLVRKTSSKSFSRVSSIGLNFAIPALANRMSRWPNSFLIKKKFSKDCTRPSLIPAPGPPEFLAKERRGDFSSPPKEGGGIRLLVTTKFAPWSHQKVALENLTHALMPMR